MTLLIKYAPEKLAVDDLVSAAWDLAAPVRIDRYWSGEVAPEGRTTELRALWTDEALDFRFDCRQAEPLAVSADPQFDKKTIGLWERDVCEAFIAPEAQGLGAGGRGSAKASYFEFEVAPTGEWLDLLVHPSAEGRVTDWEYRSGLTVSSQIFESRVLIGMRIPWEAFSARPFAGDVWRGNFFRCVGEGPDRGYLAWQPTGTPKPNFHVPEKFGELVFGE